MLEHVGLQ